MSRRTIYYDDYLGRTVDYESNRKSEAEILGYDTGGHWPTEAPAPEAEKAEKPNAEDPKAEKDRP